MQSVARILTANLAELQPGERAAAIPSIARGNESEPECRHCMDSGWRRVDLPGSAGMRQCECVAEKARRRALALIPERFRDSSFESFNPRDPKHVDPENLIHPREMENDNKANVSNVRHANALDVKAINQEPGRDRSSCL